MTVCGVSWTPPVLVPHALFPLTAPPTALTKHLNSSRWIRILIPGTYMHIMYDLGIIKFNIVLAIANSMDECSYTILIWRFTSCQSPFINFAYDINWLTQFVGVHPKIIYITVQSSVASYQYYSSCRQLEYTRIAKRLWETFLLHSSINTIVPDSINRYDRERLPRLLLFERREAR